MESIVIDEAASTVFLSDPLQRLDVGAVAKGWSVEQVCRNAPEGLLVSVGGNVRATGPKPTGNAWVVGLQSPDGDADDYLHTLNLETGSVVTSGDYQRYYVAVSYTHLMGSRARIALTIRPCVSIVACSRACRVILAMEMTAASIIGISVFTTIL